MIKQSFLDSLEGLFQDQAEALVEAEDYKSYSVPFGTAITMEVKPNTVILWLDESNQVSTAEAGNISEVEDDT